MWTVLKSLLMDPVVWKSLLALLGVVAGWYVKYWITKQADKAAKEQTRKAEQSLADSVVKQSANQTAAVNKSIDLQDKAAEEWAKKKD